MKSPLHPALNASDILLFSLGVGGLLAWHEGFENAWRPALAIAIGGTAISLFCRFYSLHLEHRLGTFVRRVIVLVQSSGVLIAAWVPTIGVLQMVYGEIPDLPTLLGLPEEQTMELSDGSSIRGFRFEDMNAAAWFYSLLPIVCVVYYGWPLLLTAGVIVHLTREFIPYYSLRKYVAWTCIIGEWLVFSVVMALVFTPDRFPPWYRHVVIATCLYAAFFFDRFMPKPAELAAPPEEIPENLRRITLVRSGDRGWILAAAVSWLKALLLLCIFVPLTFAITNSLGFSLVPYEAIALVLVIFHMGGQLMTLSKVRYNAETDSLPVKVPVEIGNPRHSNFSWEEKPFGFLFIRKQLVALVWAAAVAALIIFGFGIESPVWRYIVIAFCVLAFWLPSLLSTERGFVIGNDGVFLFQVLMSRRGKCVVPRKTKSHLFADALWMWQVELQMKNVGPLLLFNHPEYGLQFDIKASDAPFDESFVEQVREAWTLYSYPRALYQLACFGRIALPMREVAGEVVLRDGDAELSLKLEVPDQNTEPTVLFNRSNVANYDLLEKLTKEEPRPALDNVLDNLVAAYNAYKNAGLATGESPYGTIWPMSCELIPDAVHNLHIEQEIPQELLSIPSPPSHGPKSARSVLRSLSVGNVEDLQAKAVAAVGRGTQFFANADQ